MLTGMFAGDYNHPFTFQQPFPSPTPTAKNTNENYCSHKEIHINFGFSTILFSSQELVRMNEWTNKQDS